ncbi:MAG: carboxypeptidase-like regulatory domain-containing protein, partial [Tannerellaceae bacterium]|nr:carboxypeptidase-like regulatory domain-containing protein [Tannerellaceae bacterium]
MNLNANYWSKMRPFLLLLVGLSLFPALFAQSGTVKIQGNVIEKATLEPVIGASILIKGTSQGTITDFDGNFQLEAPGNAVKIQGNVIEKATLEPVIG